MIVVEDRVRIMFSVSVFCYMRLKVNLVVVKMVVVFSI